MSDVRYVHQHFDRPAKFGWFTPYEWMLCAVGAVVTVLWWKYVSPFGFSSSATGAVLLVTPLYVTAQLGDGRSGRRARIRMRIALGWWLRPRRVPGGRSGSARGYAVTPAAPPVTADRATRVPAPDFQRLWL